jgi:hypothetical protein
MRAILPGKPQAKLQAITTGAWNGFRIVVRLTPFAYHSGNAKY